MSKFEHMDRLDPHHKSEIYRDFLGLMGSEFPMDYCDYIFNRYNLTPTDLVDGMGARYLGGDFERVKGEIINLHGGSVLEKANLAWAARNGKTYLTFEPCLWKRAPLVCFPGTSNGIIDQVVGFVPWEDGDLIKAELRRWHYSTPKNVPSCRSPLFMENLRMEGAIVLCADPFRAYRLRQENYDAVCIPHFCRWLVGWQKKIAPGSCVYVAKSEAGLYPEELGMIESALFQGGVELKIVDISLGDIMLGLRLLCGSAEKKGG